MLAFVKFLGETWAALEEGDGIVKVKAAVKIQTAVFIRADLCPVHHHTQAFRVVGCAFLSCPDPRLNQKVPSAMDWHGGGQVLTGRMGQGFSASATFDILGGIFFCCEGVLCNVACEQHPWPHS